MDITDQELLNDALNPDVVEHVETQEAPAVDTGDTNAQPRDDSGRFAPKQPAAVVEQPVGQQPVTAEPPSEEAHVPSWRMRELREERDAAVRRNQEIEANFQRQIAELQNRLPKQEPQPVPDMYEDPNGFVQHGVQQAVDPIKSEITRLREFYSQREATRQFGEETVKSAYDAIANGVQSRDPEVMATYQRAMQSMDPYGEIVKWHQQRTVYTQIGNDPNAWFEKQLEERMKDPAFAGSVLGRIQQSAAPSAGRPNIKLPPSLNRATSASPTSDNGEDDSDAGLLKSALRR